MAAYVGWAEILDEKGRVLDYANAELWSTPDPANTGWGGDLLPAGRRRFAAGIELRVGTELVLRLPGGRTAHCEVERVRPGDPAMVRVGGRDAPPFG